jgi:hypothetical protein
MSAFPTSHFPMAAMDGKIEQCICNKFCVKLSELLLKPLKCFMKLLENILQTRQRFLNDIHVSRLVESQLKMTNVQGDQAPAKQQKMFKRFENSSTNTITERSMSSQTLFGSDMEFSRRS